MAMSEVGPLRRLLRYMNPHRGTVWLATICSVLNKIWDLAPPLLIGLAVDVVVEREDSFLAGFGYPDPWHQILILSVVTFLIWGLESIFEYFYGILWRNLAQTVQHEMRLETFSHVQKQWRMYHELKKFCACRGKKSIAKLFTRVANHSC